MAESIQQYEVAAGERLYDALAIALTDGREDSRGSTYPFGYVIEMVLKTAFFRLIGWSQITAVDLKEVAKALGKPKLTGSQSHDLALLHQALISERQRQKRPFPAQLEADLDARLKRVITAWTVDQRYDGNRAAAGEIAQMYDDAGWFFANRLALAH